jgi:hypothetical protein
MMRPPWYRRLARKLDKTIASWFFIDQWVIMTAPGMDYESLHWDGLTLLAPEKDRYWGDPFILKRGDLFYVFIEEKLYATGKGYIACLTLDAAGRPLKHDVVLERPYHISYPCLFEHEGELFMMPETAANGTLEVYRCKRFPEQWEFCKILMHDIYAVDATPWRSGSTCWLFANVREPSGSSLNALHLFWAENPLSDSWTAHPRNPVVRDIASARPAGSLFLKDGQLIRPAQDSSHRYGGALRFNRITELTETDYGEQTVAVFSPPGGRLRATHTFNQAGGLTVIDAVLRRRK